MSSGLAAVAPGTTECAEFARRPRPVVQGTNRLKAQTLRPPSTAGTIFGIYGVSNEALPLAHRAASRSSTLDTQGRTASGWFGAPKRTSLGHALLLDKGATNYLDYFYLGDDIKPSQFIVGRQTSARPHHVCYSLQVSEFIVDAVI
ncbi:hypothetical protein BIW11_06299 [Tropilaelaps mercedesae]|uniref:Uncharacterized protein n=1 Tax=Tropilaelaps mercedesae TaxID=418985 RepID=A0A1V9XYT0_9ACAR|nr:hypothetical protein BIW11_06299 [Tropilaelaps mercedesae]